MREAKGITTPDAFAACHASLIEARADCGDRLVVNCACQPGQTEWGAVAVRLCGYPPWGAQAIVNRHDWVERAACVRQLRVAKAGSGFVAGSDFAALDRLTAQLPAPEFVTLRQNDEDDPA